MKTLTSPEVESLVPAISEAWCKQQYPHTLSIAFKGLLDRGRPPAMVYLVIAKFAEIWALEHLMKEHSASMVNTDHPVVVWALMDDVMRQVEKMEQGET